MAKSVAKKDALRLDVVKALRAVKPVQRLAIEALLHSATRPLALEKLRDAGVDIEMKTLNVWCNGAKFIRALKAREMQLAAQITKESVINNARNLLDVALVPKKVLYKGEDTGEREVNVGAALNANEQMGKAIGAFNADHSGKVAVIIDIDFSGRKDPVREVTIEDAEYSEVREVTPEENKSLPPPELAEWLQ